MVQFISHVIIQLFSFAPDYGWRWRDEARPSEQNLIPAVMLIIRSMRSVRHARR